MPTPSIICRGKNLHLSTMKQFFAALPREPMPKGAFGDYAEKRMTGFKQTHSQIARQMALYYCDSKGVCHPRFCRELTLAEILSYSRYWAEHYFVPNPYTPSFPPTCSPTNVYAHIVANCTRYGGDFDQLLFSIFNLKLNEGDKAKSYLLQFTGIVEDTNGKFVCDNLSALDPKVDIDRNDEEAYFHYYDGWQEAAVIHDDSQKRQDEFLTWMLSEKRLNKNYAKDIAKQYLPSISDELKMPPTKTIWHGLREYLYNEKPVKTVYAVADKKEFDTVFGGLGKLFGKSYDNGAFDKKRYKDCWDWQHESNGSVRAAWVLYDEFLKCKDGRATAESQPLHVDRLEVALKLFADKRKEDGEGGWKKEGWSVNGRIRKYFGGLTQAKILAFTEAQFEEFFLGPIDPVTKTHKSDEAMMWAGSTGSGWDKIKPDPLSGIMPSLGGIAKIQQDPGIAAIFLLPGTSHPKGFGPSVTSELLMKFHPDACFKHGRVTHEVLTSLGLIDFPYKSNYSDAEYKQVCGVAAKILGKMAAMKLPRQINEDGTEDTSKPDYLTVNEFIWFVNENKDLIKEKVMSKAMKKPTTKKITTGKATISNLLKNTEDSLMTMLIAGLLTKPLAILAGVSGTGKSRMVRHLAYKTCLDEDLKPSDESAPGNFKMVQVKPSWHDSADLLGYRSAVNEKHEYVSTDFVKFVLKAHAYPNTPFFVCLDEMNLAPVEHYFAEFLSACESIRKIDGKNEWTSDPIVAATDFDNNVLNLGGDVLFESADAALDAALKKTKARIEKEGLFIPRNLFVVGTVNMDDSTGGFSRKVLDRAMTIVMNEVHFEDLQKEDKDLTLSEDNLFTTAEIAKFIERKDFNKDMMSDDFRNQLEDIRTKLEKTPFALAYRFARETCMYKYALNEILDAGEVVKNSEGNPKKSASGADINADRVCGDIALDHMILMKLLPRLTGTTDQRKKVIDDINVFLDTLIKDKKVSKETLKDMVERAGGNGGYLSFWP